jgi:hypothetical protein
MKPFQIGYNIVNNQIADILVDELGTVILLDQNALPRHSLGEDWGKNNLAKAYVAMKNFQMLPLDTSITNTENALAFQHYQKLDLEQTNRLMSRIQLANYFKLQAFETYFIQHCDYLMPRVHQMRTDLAQYYQSTKPSTRLQYITSMDERKNFEINGTDLLLRDLNIFCTTKANHRAMLEQLKQMAIQNNTTGASIYDLGNVLKSESIAEVSNILKDAEKKQQAQKQAEMQQAQQMQDQQLQAKAEEARMKMEFEAQENAKDREADILQAQIKAAGYGAMQDMNQNQESDYVDYMDKLQKTEQYQDTMNFERQKESTKQLEHRDKMNIEQQKIQAQQQIAQTQLQIARENKNKFDKVAEDKKKKK